MREEPRTLLVTGGAGFIGSTLVRYLVEETPHRVVNLDSLTYAGNLESVHSVTGSPRYRFERVDVRDGPEVRRVFREHRPDAVLHLAAESHVDRSIDGPAVFLDTNVRGTLVLLEAARDAWSAQDPTHGRSARFLHVSTDEVYGSAAEHERFTEDSPLEPNSPYAASKAAADHLVRAWGVTYGVPVLTTRCCNNYGPFQFPEKLIPHTILSAVEGRDLPLYGDGLHVREWLHVDDHVRALMTVLDGGSPGRCYNVAGGGGRPNLEVVRVICDTLDEVRPRSDGASYRSQIIHTDDRPGHDRRYAIEATRIETELGWAPVVGFDEGLRETIRWYLDHPDWWKPIRERVYHGERLGRAEGGPLPENKVGEGSG